MATRVSSIRSEIIYIKQFRKNGRTKYRLFLIKPSTLYLLLFQGRCYSGECKTRDSQCKYIWGSSKWHWCFQSTYSTVLAKENTKKAAYHLLCLSIHAFLWFLFFLIAFFRPAALSVRFSSLRDCRVRETLLWEVKYRGDRKRELWERWRQMGALQQTVSQFPQLFGNMWHHDTKPGQVSLDGNSCSLS